MLLLEHVWIGTRRAGSAAIQRARANVLGAAHFRLGKLHEVAGLACPAGIFHATRQRTQRSISPSTMSRLAFTAITSDRSAPSTIFGRAERLMKRGPRMRQRTGFEPPSLTTYKIGRASCRERV